MATRQLGRHVMRSKLLLNASTLSIRSNPTRWLNLHEYQSKELMRQNGLTVQKFATIGNVDQIEHVLYNQQSELFNCREYVVKAQVLAGGRGKGHFLNSKLKGGVKLTTDKSLVKQYSQQMLNDRLVTAQTGAEGELVQKLMIAEALDIEKELYLAILLDRDAGGPLLVACEQGGVNIEEVAEKDPNAIKKFKLPMNEQNELSQELVEQIARDGLNLKDEQLVQKACREIRNLFNLFVNLDATQVEINPFGLTPDKQVVCFDAKIQFDENANFRQKWMQQAEEENLSVTNNEREQLAKKYNLNFVPMEGNIGCLVNGAGLAMATMDIIHLHGGKPANFLDVGGAVSDQGVANAFTLITQDTNVKAILVNIFGGIVNCELIAKGLINSLNIINVPLVVRLEGTNEAQAKRLLADHSDRIVAVDNLEDAARIAVELATTSRS